LKGTEKGEGNEVLDVADIALEATDRGEGLGQGRDLLEDGILGGAGLFSGCQVPSTGRTQLDEQNCDWGGTEFLPEAGKGDGNPIPTYLFHLNTRWERSMINR
jgi:hypothetical protein